MGIEMKEVQALQWPLFTIDFEASSLSAETFPIEVGVCRWMDPASVIEGWSTLILPTAAWDSTGDWSHASQAVHGIGRSELGSGMTPTEAIIALNAILGEQAAFCDGGPYDLHWARMLASESTIRPTFAIGDFDHLAMRCDADGYQRLVRWLDRAPAAHRARDDAERLMRAFAIGIGQEQGISCTIVV
jgi:DNA polymerase III subunit epsilon